MDYSRLFARSWAIVWRTKFLWLLGFFLGLGSSGGSLLRIIFGSGLVSSLRRVPFLATQPDELFTQTEFWLETAGPWLVGGITAILVLSLGGWLVTVWAEGAVIGTALGLERGGRVTLPHALKMGWRLLPRFVAIDTLVFFPLFLIMLLILLVIVAILLGTLGLSFQDVGTGTLAMPLVIGLLCMIPLFCLMAPVGFLTAAFRTLAFRDTAACGTGVRSVVGHTWQVLRPNFLAVVILMVLLAGLQYLLDMILSFISVALFTAAAAPGLLSFIRGTSSLTAGNLLATFFTIIIALLTLFPQIVFHVFTATVWTLAYEEMLPRERLRNSHLPS